MREKTAAMSLVKHKPSGQDGQINSVKHAKCPDLSIFYKQNTLKYWKRFTGANIQQIWIKTCVKLTTNFNFMNNHISPAEVGQISRKRARLRERSIYKCVAIYCRYISITTKSHNGLWKTCGEYRTHAPIIRFNLRCSRSHASNTISIFQWKQITFITNCCN